MTILIVEDEQPAARQLNKLLQKLDPSVSIVQTLDSVEATVAWLRACPMPDAIFLDIQIADGLSFDIFNHVEIQSAVVFTTAFDQYAVKAFRVNALDYLLKPIDEEELASVLQKIQQRKLRAGNGQTPQYQADFFQNLMAQMQRPPVYRERFLVKIGQHLSSIEAIDVAYFFSENSLTQVQVFSNKKHFVENTLDELESAVNPKQFFRINRKLLVNLSAIAKISQHFNGRLKLELTPQYADEVFVARERVSDFKTWLGG